jgi:hypothetical protein
VDYYLIVSEGDREYVLRRGPRRQLEALARKFRAARLFRYVRVDSSAPPQAPRRPPHGPGGRVAGGGDAGSAPEWQH